jgi:hypothetical protein
MANEVVVMAKDEGVTPLIVMEKICGCEAAPVESFAVTVKLYVPAVVGVPLIPPLGVSDSPMGSVPVSDQVYGGWPPEAEREAV